MRAHIRLLFFILLFIPVLLGASTPQISHESTLIRRASPEKIQKYFSDKDFMYERDNAPATNFFDKIIRWIEEILFTPIGRNSSIRLWDIILYAIAFTALILIVYYLIKSDRIGMFSREANGAMTDIGTVHEDIHEIDFDKIIAEAIANKYYRIAIRYLYLKSLRDLSLKGFIMWKADKTNLDYMNELRLPAFEKPFGEATRLFDYAWYGNIEINEIIFQRIKIVFDKLSAQINSGA